jgi:hypothetical protein
MSQPDETRRESTEPTDTAPVPGADLTEPADRLPGEDEAAPDAPDRTGAEPAEDRGRGTPEPPG